MKCSFNTVCVITHYMQRERIIMNNIINSFIKFLFTDVKSKTETKDLAVLIRLTCLIYSAYYFITGVTISFFQHYYVGLILISAIGLLVAAFICTYENHTLLGFSILISVMIVFSTLLSLSIGFEYDYHITIFLTVLLLYFNKTKHMTFKRLYTVGVSCYLMVLAEISDSLIRHRLAEGFPTIFVRAQNMLVLTGSLGIISYCYCTKFNQAEEKLKAINDNLEKMANLDTLTGLSNRRHMNEYLAALVSEYSKNNKTFTVAIGDVDFFKKVNDTYGHEAGDYVLTTLSSLFQEHMKGQGHVARWGGEEFLFVFENANIDKAYTSLNSLRKIIESTTMNFKECSFNVTMTYGMEEYNDRIGIEASINKADSKLYTGKTTGRNKVVK